MGTYDPNITTIYATSLLELEVGDAAMPSLDEYWMAPLTRIVIGKQIEELPTNSSGVAARDSHRIGA